jgi:hypothetical protein
MNTNTTPVKSTCMNDFMESLGEYEEFDENGRVTSPLVVGRL